MMFQCDQEHKYLVPVQSGGQETLDDVVLQFYLFPTSETHHIAFCFANIATLHR